MIKKQSKLIYLLILLITILLQLINHVNTLKNNIIYIKFNKQSIIQPITPRQPTYKLYHKHSTALNSVIHNFNPYMRRKNSRIKWFETDLESFYTFVEKQPLLTSQQELKYGKALKMGIQIDNLRNKLQLELNKTSKITNEELSISLGCSNITLEKILKYSEISKIRLVNSNMRLVLSIVSRYRTNTISNSELIAEGVRGLARAVMRYDYSKGFRLSTYATWYVHQSIADYVRIRKHPAKMPSRYLLLYRKVKQYSSDYKVINSRLPTAIEISKALDETVYDISKVLNMQQYPILLHSPWVNQNSNVKSEGKDRHLEDILPSLYKAPISFSSSVDLRLSMENLFESNLNDVEKDILRLRLGLDDGREKPVKEVGRKFQISWKQVKHFEKNAILKLQSSPEAKEFVTNYHALI